MCQILRQVVQVHFSECQVRPRDSFARPPISSIAQSDNVSTRSEEATP